MSMEKRGVVETDTPPILTTVPVKKAADGKCCGNQQACGEDPMSRAADAAKAAAEKKAAEKK